MTQKEYAQKLLPVVENVLPMATRLLGSRTKADDLVQEVMLSLWERRQNICVKSSYKAFLYRVVKNRCLDKLRQKQCLTLGKDVEERVETKMVEEFDTMQWIENCIQTLPPQQQDVINMREIDGLEFSEISDCLGITEANARMLLSRAKKRLQKILPEGL